MRIAMTTAETRFSIGSIPGHDRLGIGQRYTPSWAKMAHIPDNDRADAKTDDIKPVSEPENSPAYNGMLFGKS
jgi:hypothetical protein